MFHACNTAFSLTVSGIPKDNDLHNLGYVSQIEHVYNGSGHLCIMSDTSVANIDLGQGHGRGQVSSVCQGQC